jgi:MscS family membrane protein
MVIISPSFKKMVLQKMEQLQKFKTLFSDVWNTEALGADVGTWIIVVLIFLFFVMLRGVFTRFLFTRLGKLTAKTKTDLDDHVFKAVEKPVSLLPVVIGLFIATSYLDPEGKLAGITYNLEKSLITIVLFWSLHNAMDPVSAGLTRLEKMFSKPMVSWLRKGLKFLLIFIGVATVLEIWGIKVAPIIAGFGLFGVAVALGAQDMFKNLIAGLTVIAEKRFQPGDWILVDGIVEGTVEDIGFRSTQVRRFDKAPVHVPNAKLADSAVTNFSAMTHRRIYWKIGVTYDTSIAQLKEIRDGIEKYVLKNADFAAPEDVATFVRIDSFNSSSIDIMLYCFTKTTNWGEWLEIKEELAYRIKDIVEGAGSGFAFPSQSLYVEALPGSGPDIFVPPKKTKTPKKEQKKTAKKSAA